MGKLLRSVEMQRVQLFVQIEAAHDTVDELAQFGLVQFLDLNPDVNAFQRNFINEVRRADELQRQLRLFEGYIDEYHQKYGDTNKQTQEVPIIVEIDQQDHSAERVSFAAGKSGPALMDELEALFSNVEEEIVQIKNNQMTLNRSLAELTELLQVLEKADRFFGDDRYASQMQHDGDEDGAMVAGNKHSALGYVTGVLAREKMYSFERVLWRTTRGNLYLRQSEIDGKLLDVASDTLIEKNVFIIFFQGQRAGDKIKKLCESFGADLYNCPDNLENRRDRRKEILSRLEDLKVVLDRTREHTHQILLKISGDMNEWKEIVLKEKAIYHTMNLFNYDVGRKCLIAEGWAPKSSTEDIQIAMRRATERTGSMVPSILTVVHHEDTPPTYFELTPFTATFQAVTDSYGIPRYREINPTPFNIVMFPFLFGVMFGDLGHGLILFLAAAYFILDEKRLLNTKLNEMVEMVFQGRYLLITMAFAAMYCGLIYNEVFVIPMNIFGSAWEYPSNSTVAQLKDKDYCYPFGVDPLWIGAANQLAYVDSLKMKLSVNFGVLQMAFGVILSMMNAAFEEQYLELACIGVPQLIFLLCTFGYMDWLIVYKWTRDWSVSGMRKRDPNWQVPLLLNVMIQMFLKPWNVELENAIYDPSTQRTVQCFLLLFALSCVPVMLLGVPLYGYFQHKPKGVLVPATEREMSLMVDGKEKDDDGVGQEEGAVEAFDFGEEMVHSIIHTIEYCLGAVSNTASYLRLWALSLAHSQLSEVFFEGVRVALPLGTIPIFVAWTVWAGMTLGVLIVMESLSAFLHSLRLHWVEFQNKFYRGDGRPFLPLSYAKIIAGDEDTMRAIDMHVDLAATQRE